MHMRRFILSSVTWPALRYFSALSHKRHVFVTKLLNKIWLFYFVDNSVWYISYSKNNSAKYYHKCRQVFM